MVTSKLKMGGYLAMVKRATRLTVAHQIEGNGGQIKGRLPTLPG